MEEVMVTKRVKNSTIFLIFSCYENSVANNIEVSSNFKCSGRSSTFRCEWHKNAIKLSRTFSISVGENTYVFEKFFPHSLRARKKYSSGSKLSYESGAVYCFKSDSVTVNNVTYFIDSGFKQFLNSIFQYTSLNKYIIGCVSSIMTHTAYSSEEIIQILEYANGSQTMVF